MADIDLHNPNRSRQAEIGYTILIIFVMKELGLISDATFMRIGEDFLGLW